MPKPKVAHQPAGIPGAGRAICLALGVSCALPGMAVAETFSADVWADNWFEMRIDGVQVAEDSVPITTERSFNAESFSFEAETPFVIGLVAKDFKENDTGLEYIGSRRQQMGDGGVILQIRDAAGQTIAVSDGSWRCLVTHSAPLDKACERESDPVAGEGVCTFEITEEPANWDRPDFDASGWRPADVHSERAVSPKDGYDRIRWSSAAEFIWGPDLEQDNTVLCRLAIE
ncbi:MAG: PEBP family protein [Rhodobacteraceae bacterium]|nr:PEBP family protein [Paracoccaceae bacterium]